jgi:isocitrate/isopropylmalate dehydrogenase
MKIAVLPGDGIGPEIVKEAVKVLNVLGEKFELEEAPVRSCSAPSATGSTTRSNARCARSRPFSVCASTCNCSRTSVRRSAIRN